VLSGGSASGPRRIGGAAATGRTGSRAVFMDDLLLERRYQSIR
jgi:hypothetical protein